MTRINIGIIGCGAAALRYYLLALKNHLNIIENLYLVDKNRSMAETLKEEFGQGQIFEDFRDISEKVDGVIIILPNSLHYPVAMEFLKAGVHVLCEKPLAETATEVAEMNKTAKERKVYLTVNQTRRMFPTFKEVRKIIASGDMGKIKSIRYVEGNTFEWQSATGFYVNPSLTTRGVLFDVGSHVLDTICWWLGGKPDLKEYSDDSFGGPESVAHLRANYQGCDIDVFLNRLNVLENRFCITFEKGKISGQLFDWQNLEIENGSGKKRKLHLGPKVKTYPEFVYPIIDNFIASIKNEQETMIPGTSVQSSISLIDACYSNRKRLKLPWYDSTNLSSNVPDEKILVTGATGFLGGRIVELLHINKKEVRAAIRQWATAARLGRFPVDIVEMDLMNKENISSALDGVTHVIHCAKGSAEVTTSGTQNLLDVALEKGIKHFIHLSTADIYGNATGEITEDIPLSYSGTEYNKMKVDAEKICWEYSKKGLPVTIFRPSIVYGPFSKNWTVRFAALFAAQKWGIYDTYGEGKCNLIYVDDLINAILTSLNNEKAFGEAFNVNFSQVITWNEYFQKFNDLMGLPPLKTINTKKAYAKTIAIEPVRFVGNIVRDHFMGPVKKMAETFEFADRLMRSTETTLKSTPAPDDLKLYNRQALYKAEKINKILGFSPAVSIENGLKISVNWVKQQGFLRKSDKE